MITMDQITAIKPTQRDPKRVTVRVGRKVMGTLPISKVHELGLEVGQVWDDALAERVAQAGAFDKALRQAMNRLNRRALSRRDLGQKLHGLGYDEPVREAVLDRLTELKFIDDEVYGRALIDATMRRKPAGPQLLRQKLYQKGIDRSLIERLVSEATDAQDLAPGAVELARKKLRTLQRVDPETRKRRLYGLLARRGFNPDTISSVMAELADELAEGGEPEWE
jgi:regulatory protein